SRPSFRCARHSQIGLCGAARHLARGVHALVIALVRRGMRSATGINCRPRRFVQNNGSQGGHVMKYAVAMSAALLVAAFQPALAQSPSDLVTKAVAAQGGADALRALKTVSIQADAKHWDPGQSYSVSGEPRFMGDSTISMTWDLANGMA